MEIAGYFAALLIGISLGLIGGGGSILTIPVLVYLFGIQPSIATGYSLFIVGSSSLAGAYKNYRKGDINFKAVIYFGTASIITVVLIRKFILPAMPEDLFLLSRIMVTKSLLIMLLFGIVMIIASMHMIKKEAVVFANKTDNSIRLPKALLRGIETGILTGLLGAGGGFIIIPVLVFSFHLSMKEAIGTSLLIIAMSSLFGFASDLFCHHFDWPLLLALSAIAITGTFIGTRLSGKIPGHQLKKGFGWFVLAMGVYIMLHELFLK
ncbi:MAG: sulfite exporter TauE/SafE family protein [Sediminibacterium sp.]